MTGDEELVYWLRQRVEDCLNNSGDPAQVALAVAAAYTDVLIQIRAGDRASR